MEPRLMDVLQGKEDNYILPFFWQHGESKELLEEGMQRIYDSGIKLFASNHVHTQIL